MYVYLILLFSLILSADQLTKYLTVLYLKNHDDLVIIKETFSLTYVENTGAAFGILQNSKYLFIAVTIIATVSIIYYTLKAKNFNKLYLSAACMVISGAISNMIDRLTRGYVVDMIKADFIDFPVFNFADMCIVIGAFLLCFYLLFMYKEPEKTEELTNE